MRRHSVLLVVGCAAAAVLLGLATTLLIAATGAGNGPRSRIWVGPPNPRCAAPALSGQVVDVTLTDMGPGMHGNWRGQSGDGWWEDGGPRWHGPGMMRLTASPSTVPAGTISLRAFNQGVMPHEVVVLPLPTGQSAGQRAVGQDGKIDEAGSLGEASRGCAAGSGDGIEPGATGWTTLNLRPGHYELVCNLPGHYPAGMYAELDVTG